MSSHNAHHDQTGPARDPSDDQPEIPTICNICLNEPPINAVQLECGHIFCYLCTKSVAQTTGVCPLCRSEIKIQFDYQEHSIVDVARVPTSTNGYYWFYEGYRGWWLFDADTNTNIECGYSQNVKQIRQFIAGSYYLIDLEKMEQKRIDGSGRTRKIKRATLETDNILGMAGLKGPDFEEILDIMKSAAQFQM